MFVHHPLSFRSPHWQHVFKRNVKGSSSCLGYRLGKCQPWVDCLVVGKLSFWERKPRAMKTRGHVVSRDTWSNQDAHS